MSGDIFIEESLHTQQHTMLLDDSYYSQLAPTEGSKPQSLLSDEHAEELSFPCIYLVNFRTFKESLESVKPFQIATPELGWSDR